MIALSATGRTVGWTDGTQLYLGWVDIQGELTQWPIDLADLGLGPGLRVLAVDDGFYAESGVARCLVSNYHGTLLIEASRRGWETVQAVHDSARREPLGPSRMGLLYRDSHVTVPVVAGLDDGPSFAGRTFDFARAPIRGHWRELRRLDYARYGHDEVVLLQWPHEAMIVPDGTVFAVAGHAELGLVRARRRPHRIVAMTDDPPFT